MSENILLCLMGLPRSGKTTWTKKQGWPVVCPDSIRLALHGKDFIADAEPFVWAIAMVMVKALFLSGTEIVVVDATNTTKKRRDFWQGEDWITRFTQIKTDKETCIQRAKECGRPNLIPVIERMADQWEPLEEDEVEWE